MSPAKKTVKSAAKTAAKSTRTAGKTAKSAASKSRIFGGSAPKRSANSGVVAMSIAPKWNASSALDSSTSPLTRRAGGARRATERVIASWPRRWKTGTREAPKRRAASA